MKRLASTLAFLILIATGCGHTQPAPSANPVIGWTLTPGAGAAATWTQTLYVATVPTLTSACPTPGGSTYKSAGTAAGNATNLVDSGETPGTIVCAIDQESFVQSGQPFYSGYSPTSAPFQIPPLPTAPGMPAPAVTSASLDQRPGLQPPTQINDAACGPECFKTIPAPGMPRARRLRNGQ